MSPASTDRLLHSLHRLLGTGPAATDRQLLERFTALCDEAAFAALVSRHGPMVLGVCRRVLGDRPAAEDVFQATFLVLARNAASVRQRETVGGWLYGVAHRLALKARADEARRRRHERGAADLRPTSMTPDDACRELLAVLDEELARLPERHRLPLLLCYLEGRTQDEAARELGWSLSTLRRRLERGRELLRLRMTRRGATLSAGLFAAALTAGATSASVPAALAQVTARAALGDTAPAVEALARAGLGTARLTQGKVAVALLLIVTAAVGAWAWRGGEQPPQPPLAPAEAKPAAEPARDLLPPGALVRLGTVEFKLRGNVRALAFSPDGKRLAATGDHGPEVRVWDTATGQTVRSFPGRCYFDYDLAFSPDGKWLAVAEANGPFHVWDLAMGKEDSLRNNPAKGKVWLFAAAFTADGKPVMVFRGDGDEEPLSLYDGRTVERICTFDRDLGGRALARAADRKSIAVARGKTVSVMALETGKELGSLPGHTAEVTGLALSGDGKLLASAADGDAVSLWNVTNGKELVRLPVAAEDAKVGRRVALSEDGKRLAVAGYKDGTIRLLDAAGGKELHRLDCPDMLPSCLAFSPDGKTLVAGGNLGVRVWDTATGKEWHAERPGHTGEVRTIAYAPDGKSLLSGGQDGTVRLWDARTGKQLRLLARGPGGIVERVAFAPDGRGVASASWGGVKTTVRDAEGKVRLEFDGSAKGYTDVAFSPDGRLLAVGEEQGKVTLRAADTGRLVRTLVARETEQPGALGLTFSPDGRHLAGNRGWKTVLWDVETGREDTLDGWRCSQGPLFTPDGETLVGGRGDKVVLWRVGPRTMAGEFRVPMKEAKKGSRYELAALTLSPDGRTVVVSATDGSVSAWELASRRERFRLTVPDGPAWSLAFAPDGRTLATGDALGTVLVWDVASLPSPLRPPEKFSAGDADRLWSDLSGQDAAKAYQAIRTLAALPAQSVPLLRERLKPVAAPDAALLKRLIAALDDNDFAKREKATEELAKLGDAAALALREAAASGPPEAKRRAEELLNRLKDDATENLRAARAVEALERAGTKEARALLKALAGGVDGARLTREAKAALKRLDKG